MLIANGNASGVGGHREVLDGAVRQLRDRGARVEAHVTTSLDELAHLVHEADRRVVLLGGDGSVHAFANVDGPRGTVPELKHPAENPDTWDMSPGPAGSRTAACTSRGSRTAPRPG